MHPFCFLLGHIAGTVKKVSYTLKISHEKYSKAPVNFRDEYYKELEEAIKANKEIKSNLNRLQDDLNPIRVLKLFEKITDEVLGRKIRSLFLTHLNQSILFFNVHSSASYVTVRCP